MPETTDPRDAVSRSAVAQLAAVHLIGLLALPVAGVVLATLAFGSVAAAAGTLVLSLIGGVGLMFFAATATRHACPATVTAGGRLVWALVVTVVGTVGLGCAVWFTERLGVQYGRVEPWIVAAGLPYVGTAMFFIGWRSRLAAVIAMIALVGSAGFVVRREGAEDRRAELVARLQVPLDLVYTAEIPNYRRTVFPTGASAVYEPSDQALVKYWREQDIVLTVSRTPVQGPDCGPEPLLTPAPPPVLNPPDAPVDAPAPVQPPPPPPARPDQISCRPDGDALRYRLGPGAHEYIRTVGDTVLRAGAGTVVDKALLRQAVLVARPVTAEELEKELPGG